MPGRIHVGFQDHSIVVRSNRAHLGDILGRLPVHHLAVIEGCSHQHVGIVLRLNVVVRRVGNHVIESGLLLGITPLLEFTDGERQRLIEHGVHDVHERNAHQGSVK